MAGTAMKKNAEILDRAAASRSSPPIRYWRANRRLGRGLVFSTQRICAELRTQLTA